MASLREKRQKIGEVLLSKGLVTPEQIEKALALQKEQRNGRVGSILKKMGAITDRDLVQAVSEQLALPFVELSKITVDPDAVKTVSEAYARRHQILPLYKQNQTLVVAMVDPLQIFIIDDLKRTTGYEIQPVVISETDLNKALDRYYSVTETIQQAVRDIAVEEVSVVREEERGIDLKKLAEEPPVIKLVNMVITQAVREGASDIHLEPDGTIMRIRYRVDGLMREVLAPPRSLQAGVTSRIKIMANLDIATKRVPQDGRIQTRVGDKEIDIRVSTLPTVFGEKVVMRILDKSSVLLGLGDLGFDPDTLHRFKKLIVRPYGFFLVTGPTGSGKTTTLYAALAAINTVEKNIVTIEDPVEYQLRMINQVPVNPKAGVTFATALRSVLRQDPDVIMIGEIRDKETATIAIQAALTGHLVFSTLHTNDASGAIARLIDMGVEPYLVVSSLIGVLAQRLLRRVCPRCKKPDQIPPDLLTTLGIGERRDATFMRGHGCQECKEVGYSGRIGIYELLLLDETIRGLTLKRVASSEICASARQNGMKTLREDGLEKACKGMTTIEEVLRVTQEVEE